METRAPYALIGLFVIAVIAAGFGFVYWLNNAGGLGERTVYRVRFENTVSGLLKGAAVLFNGMRVGEVTALKLDAGNPKLVTATIAVDAGTPVRADTQAGLEFQGLTGVPVIALQGGSKPFGARTGSDLPTLDADPMAGQSMTNAARITLQRLDGILSDNADAIRSTIANLNTFTGALARNSGRVDNIVTGLERMTGGGKTTDAAQVYDLTAPTKFAGVETAPKGQMAITPPAALLVLDSRHILVRPAPGDDQGFAKAEWADNVPNLIQSKIIESFENAGLGKDIVKATDNIAGGKQLSISVRKFQITTAPEATADIELSVRVLGDDGHVIDAKVFQASQPIKELNPATAAKALDDAFGRTATELVVWASHLF